MTLKGKNSNFSTSLRERLAWLIGNYRQIKVCN